MTAAAPVPTPGRVLVAVDGSAPSALALRWGAFLAASMGGGLEAMICWNWGPAGYGAYVAEWDPAGDARTVVDETVAAVFGEHRPPDLKVTVQEGHASGRLLEAGADAGMLVLGSRGRGGFAGLLLGSVSTACTEHATCPVLVVHGATPEPPR
jgi:nucleotide-binding universal stress UspA family protein